MTTGTKIGASFVFALTVIMTLGVSSYISTQRLVDANRWVGHTYLVLETLEHVLSLHKDAETAQRGYLLTGEARYLEPYDSAGGLIQSGLAQLKDLTRDNPAQEENLRKVQTLSEAKLAELRETIELRRQSGLDAAQQVIRTDRGEKIMDDLRGAVADMQVRERQLLEARTKSADASAQRTLLDLAVWTPLSLLILAVLATLVTRKVRFGGPVAPPSGRGVTWGSLALQYFFAVAAVAVAAALRWGLVRSFGDMPLFITFYPAVVLVASVAGGGPGIVTSVLSALVAAYFFIPPYGSFAIVGANDFIAVTIFLSTNLFLCVLAERLRRARWAEAVARQKELLAVTLASIGDGVIVTDAQGRITYLNGEAERLTGWTSAEAEGQALPAVFKIINEESRQPVESPADKVMRSGSAVGLANHTLLVARDGREIPIDDSGAPIREADGTPLGVVLIFRDFSERRRREQELQRLNRTLRARSESSRALMRAESEPEYLAEVCRIVIEGCGHAMVWIGYAEQDEARSVRPVASAGFDEGYLQALNISWADVERGRGPTGTAIRTGQVSMCRNMRTDPRFAPWRDQALQRGYASSIVLPLMSEGRAFGALTIYSKEADPFSGDEVSLLADLANDLAYGITAIRLRLAHARAQELLRQSEERLRFALEGIEAGEWELDLVDHSAHRSPMHDRIFGYEGLLPQWTYEIFLEHVLPEDRELVDRKFRQSIAEQREWDFECRIIRRDQAQRWIWACGRCQADAGGTPRRLVGIIQDITLRKHAEEAQARLAAIVESSDDAIIATGLDGRILSWNTGAQALFGYRPDEIVGRPITVLLPPECVSEEAEIIARLRRGQRCEHMETIRVAKDGRRIDVSVTVSPMKDADGRMVGASKIIHDISVRKLAEQQLKRTAEELVRSNMDLEQFAYVASHDLQEPLRMVTGYLQLIDRRYKDKLEPDAREFIDFAVDGATRMSRLITDLLEYSRINTRGRPPEPVQMELILQRALDNLRAAIHDSAAQITHDPLPTVQGDGPQLAQVFQNLVGNAIKFRSPERPVRICIGAGKKDNEWVFSVQDNGIGIEPQYAEKIFLIFQRLHGRGEYPGTGIGLAICKRIVERHGGRIWVESQPGHGSTFFFTISNAGMTR